MKAIHESLKNRLDDIDQEVVESVYPGFMASRLRMVMGMWEKGEAISRYRGVKGGTSFRQLEIETGRKQESIQKWHSLYEKYPDKNKFEQEIAIPRAERWANKALLRSGTEGPIALPAATHDTLCTADLNALVEKGLKFRTIYADPPWLYSNQGTRAATSNHYDGMTVEELCALPVKQLAADDAFLHLWTTNAFLFSCQEIMQAWGFEYRGVFVWAKPQMGIGNYWRVSHEFLLLARRGNPKWNATNLMSWGAFDRTTHSSKPEPVRQMIQTACLGPYLELFGRRPAAGWVVWGNEIERNMFEQAIASV